MSEKRKVTIVNLITGSRIIGTLILPFIISTLGPLGTALYIGALSATDAVDGYLAKERWHVSTIFGANLDAFSDKVLGIASLLYLRIYYPTMIIPILLETSIFAINFAYGRKGADVKSSYLGKFKTALLFITTTLSVLSTISLTSGLSLIIPSLICITSVVDSITLGNYIHKNRKYLKTHKPKNDVSHLGFIDTLKEIIRLLKDPKLYSPTYYKEHKDEPLLDMLLNKNEEKQTSKMEELSEVDNQNSDNEKDDYKFDIHQENELKIIYCLNYNEIARLEEFAKTHKLDPDLIMTYLSKYISTVNSTQYPTVNEMENFIIEEEQEKIKSKGFKEMS